MLWKTWRAILLGRVLHSCWHVRPNLRGLMWDGENWACRPIGRCEDGMESLKHSSGILGFPWCTVSMNPFWVHLPGLEVKHWWHLAIFISTPSPGAVSKPPQNSTLLSTPHSRNHDWTHLCINFLFFYVILSPLRLGIESNSFFTAPVPSTVPG